MTLRLTTLAAIAGAMAAAAAPKNAGYPFDGHTGFSVSNMAQTLKAGSFSVAAWVKVADAARPQMFLTLGQPNQDFSFYL